MSKKECHQCGKCCRASPTIMIRPDQRRDFLEDHWLFDGMIDGRYVITSDGPCNHLSDTNDKAFCLLYNDNRRRPKTCREWNCIDGELVDPLSFGYFIQKYLNLLRQRLGLIS